MKKLIFLIITLVFLSKQDLFAQDNRFSQFNSSPLLLNPGLAGMGNGYSRANINYRTQWTGIENSFKTTGISIDLPIFSEKMNWKRGYIGTGLAFYTDKAGAGNLGTNEINFVISSALFVGKNSKIALGIMGSYIQKSVNPDNIEWGSQYNGYEYNPELSSGENFAVVSTSIIDMSAGISYRYHTGSKAVTNNDQKLLELGLASFRLFEPKYEFLSDGESQISRRYVGHGKYLASINSSKFVVGGTFLYMMQNTSRELTFGPEFRYSLMTNTKYTGYLKDSYIGAQLLYRYKDAIIPVLFFKFGNFKLSGSYDYNLSALNGAGGKSVNGFEFSIQFNDFEGTLFGQGSKHVTMKGSTGNL
ncbi:type IX secretion system membrane protein PorP/SprF [Vicingus serpentipes]|jgi:type IX secretion system PorP/SprF family membrane protein|uniref:Type IX secretion system membrane protein PorP/SprF n=1 Tax=Vicingus serpentipes TaxID=1926625 RepID=A0A5C6RR78_9FLAO|nr:PorP/SprF family type IX secretion system membrane protein [Vicingus serpentipes]TXB64697.1 type IX secretion system membrane protein PorP/SprF [Vicingus serpentipes]